MSRMTRLVLALALVVPVPVLRAQTPFDQPRSVPLALSDSVQETIDGIAVHRIGFASPSGGRATGLLFLPTGPGRHPAVLVGHGAPGSAAGFATMTTALAMARSGAVTFALDAPHARREGPPIRFTVEDSIEQVQLAVDWRRAIDWLQSRPDVDPERIGYIGNSYGGAQGALLVGIDPRIVAAVLRVGDGGFLAHFTDPCDSAVTATRSIDGCLRWDLDEAMLPTADRDTWAAMMRPIEPIRFVGRSRAQLLFQNGHDDPLVPPRRAERLHAAAPSGATVRWYASGHRLPPEALIDGIRFLVEPLGLAPPDAAFDRWLESRTTR